MTNLSLTDSQKEILDKMPDLFTRIGLLFLLFVIMIMTALSCFIRYPDVLSGQATLNSITSSLIIAMPSTGKIQLIVAPKTIVKENQVIAIVDNTANFHDVLHLKKQLLDFPKLAVCKYDSLFSKLPMNVNLGDINIPYIKFRNSLKTIISHNDLNLYNHEIESLKEKLSSNRTIHNYKKNISNILKERLYYSDQVLQRDSLLLSQNVIPKFDYISTKSAYLLQKMQYQEYLLSQIEEKSSIEATENEIDKTYLLIKKNKEVLYNTLIDNYIELITVIETWDKKYVIKSPIAGLLEYIQFINNNRFITVNTELFNIMPTEQISEVEIVLPSQGVGKVKVGQKAIIKLTDFPSREYGNLTGRVKDISLSKINVEGKNLSFIRVELNNKGLTSYGTLIDLHSGMSATVDIVTEDKRLITRIFERVRNTFNPVLRIEPIIPNN